MIRQSIYCFLFLLSACTLPEEKEIEATEKKLDTTVIQTVGNYTANRDTAVKSLILPAPKKIKKPSGIYHAQLPYDGKMEQTVAFYNDNTYQLQEKYSQGKKDSIVVIEGNWAPSDGFIWLYRDQVLRARFNWKGDSLQYFSPLLKKSFTMIPMKDVLENQTWANRKKAGTLLYGIGNEPFWSVEYNSSDTVSFQLADWTQPVKLKMNNTSNSKDSTAYTAGNDSVQLKLTVYPFFCSDGMSDFVYKNKIRVEYNNQVYHGCGIRYQ